MGGAPRVIVLGGSGVPKGQHSWPSGPHANCVAKKFCATVKRFLEKSQAILVIQETKGLGLILRNKICDQNV